MEQKELTAQEIVEKLIDEQKISGKEAVILLNAINKPAEIYEDYVSFETAKLLKEKGFDENTSVNYFVGDDKPRGCVVGEMIYHKRAEEDTHLIACPTLQMAMKWLREKAWVICVMPLTFYCGEKASSWGYNIWAGDNLEIDEFNTPKFRTYEEACEDAIKYCLKNI